MPVYLQAYNGHKTSAEQLHAVTTVPNYKYTQVLKV